MNRLDKKQIVMWCFLFSIVFVIGNILSYFAIYAVLNVSMYDQSKYLKKKHQFSKDNYDATMPHPFVGRLALGSEKFTSELSSEPLFSRVFQSENPREIKVLLLGGSVATQLSVKTYSVGVDNFFAKKLNRAFHTDRFSVYTAAAGGVKQPEQYFRFIYLDLLGFHPDIVINMDGYNELALPLSENRKILNPAIFPRSYSRHVHAAASSRSCSKLNNWFVGLNSDIPFLELIGWGYVLYCHWEILGESSPAWWSEFLGNGENADYISQSVLIWRESSNRLYEITKQKGIDYIHVLQPNQHYPNSKTFTEAELTIAFGEPTNAATIRDYYGLMGAKGIHAEHFRDQRLIFKNVSETVYSDDCCHFNSRGVEYSIDDILKTFAPVFERRLRN